MCEINNRYAVMYPLLTTRQLDKPKTVFATAGSYKHISACTNVPHY